MIGFPLSRFLSFPLSFLFPGYRSFLAVMSEDSGDDTRWLTYWVVYAFIQFFEKLFSMVVATFPFYYEFKCVFIVILQMHDAKLAYQIYNQFLGPVIDSYEPAINRFIEAYSQQAVAITHSANKAAHKALIEHALQE